MQPNESAKRSYKSSGFALAETGADGIMQTTISFGCKHVEFMRRLISCKPLCTVRASSTQETPERLFARVAQLLDFSECRQLSYAASFASDMHQ